MAPEREQARIHAHVCLGEKGPVQTGLYVHCDGKTTQIRQKRVWQEWEEEAEEQMDCMSSAAHEEQWLDWPEGMRREAGPNGRVHCIAPP